MNRYIQDDQLKTKEQNSVEKIIIKRINYYLKFLGGLV